jgi:polyisoprenoid-binding protein YceI
MKMCPLCVVSVAGLSIAGVAFVAGHLSAEESPAPLAALTVVASEAVLSADEGFKVDPVHSTAIFGIKHQGVAYSYGRFEKIEGTFNIDAAKPEASSIDVTIDADSLSTANGKRDGHLKSGDFFSVKEFPKATFKSKSFKKAGEGKYEVTGDLTIRGQTKPMTVTVEDTGRAAGQKGEVAGVRSIFTFKRSEFGMNFMMGKGLADDVEMIVSLEGGK